MIVLPCLLIFAAAQPTQAVKNYPAAATRTDLPHDSGRSVAAHATPWLDDLPEDLRVVLLIRGSEGFKRTAHALLGAPLIEAVEVVPWHIYRQAVARAHLADPYQIRSAQRLAHPMHITHVISISERHQRGPGNKRRFLEIAVIRLLPTLGTAMTQKFYLPERKLTPGLARTVLTRIKRTLQTTAAQPAVSSRSAPRPPHRSPAQQAHPTLPPRPNSDGHDDQQANPDEQHEQVPGLAANGEPDASVEAEKSGSGHVRARLGAVVARRTGILTAVTETPPCYCPQNGGASAFYGAHLGLEGLFDPENDVTFVLLAEASVSLANSKEQNVLGSQTISSIVALGHVAAGLRWRLAAALQLMPQLGYHYFQFPLALGPFPSLGYSGPWGGLQARSDFNLGSTEWTAALEGGFMPFLATHGEGARLGQLESGLGWSVRAALQVALGAVDLGIEANVVTYNLAFSGETFLYSASRYNNVTLADQTIQVQLTAGSRFW